MSWLLLLAVALTIAWLRFEVGYRLRHFLVLLLGAVLEAHGPRTLVNGNSFARPSVPVMNRAARRAHRKKLLTGRVP